MPRKMITRRTEEPAAEPEKKYKTRPAVPAGQTDRARVGATGDRTMPGAVTMGALYVIGVLVVGLGLLLLFNTRPAEWLILGGSLIGFGGAFLAGGLVVTGLRDR